MTADDLLFAAVRAKWLDSPEQTTADLLDAADHPERLDGVTAAQARKRAGDVLLDFGRPNEAIGVYRGIADDPDPFAAARALESLAMALGETGDGAGAEAMVEASISAYAPGSLEAVDTRIFVARALVRGGEFERAQRLADEAVSAARTGAERGVIKTLAMECARGGREKVHEEVRLARQGSELDVGGVRARMTRSFDDSAWPAVVSGTLLWWPEDEGRRLIRQLPELGAVLGEPWAAHTARVESELRQAAKSGKRPVLMVVASFEDFTNFVNEESADPRLASTMTAYGVHAWHNTSTVMYSGPKPVKWPPRNRQPCWCGSGRQYQDCHGANGHP